MPRPSNAPNAPDPLRSFGRRQGRKLRPEPQRLAEEALPKWRYVAAQSEREALVPAQAGSEAAEPWGLGLSKPHPEKEIWIEIGFGGGEHLAALATMHPEVDFIGAEPYLNGVTKLLQQIEQRGLSNIRIVPDDIRPVLAALPEASITRVYLLFPDPWPKLRHHKRRILNHAFLDAVARVLKPNGILQLATDHADYSVWMLEHLLPREDFRWQAESCHDWHEPPEGWTPTRYETKTRSEGRQPVYMRFFKII